MTLTPGTAHGGGFYAGTILIDAIAYALIVAPKALGEHAPTIWIPDYEDVPSALSYHDGLSNTLAMGDAGSELARWACGLSIGGHTDWYIPSLDELELCYRNLKPTAERNYCWARSGINQNSAPTFHPYTPDAPQQTDASAFVAGGSEAFDAALYWTSTQHAAGSGNAWAQDFGYGTQSYWLKDNQFRARAVRRLAI